MDANKIPSKDIDSDELVISSIRPGMKREFMMILKLQSETSWCPLQRQRVTRSNDVASSSKSILKTNIKAKDVKASKLNSFSEAKIEAGVELTCATNVQDARMKRGGGTLNGRRSLKRIPKKIKSNESPTTLKNLLVRGLLEDQKVWCKHLEGVINIKGIRCSHGRCEGNRVISFTEFENHGGRKSKHPAENIYLENGKSLHDMLKECNACRSGTTEEIILQVIAGSDSTSIRTEDNELGGHDFTIEGFDDSRIMLCVQCEKEYSADSSIGKLMLDLQGVSKGHLFCSNECRNIDSTLQNLILKGHQQLYGNLGPKQGLKLT